MSEVLRIEQEGRVRTISLHRPETKNALSTELAWELIAAVEQAAHDDDVWVIAVTGSGDAFCSGLDLSGAGTTGSPLSAQEDFLDDVSWVGRIPLLFRELCDKPIVGGINGVAAGAGMALAMATDVRLGASSLRFIAGYPRVGASPDGGLTWTLPQAIGYEQAMRFLLENRTVDANEALHLGLVGEVVDDSSFKTRLGEYCAMLADRSPLASRLTKRGVSRAVSIDLESQVRYELANILRAFRSGDSQEARAAFFEKRPPVFKGG